MVNARKITMTIAWTVTINMICVRSDMICHSRCDDTRTIHSRAHHHSIMCRASCATMMRRYAQRRRRACRRRTYERRQRLMRRFAQRHDVRCACIVCAHRRHEHYDFANDLSFAISTLKRAHKNLCTREFLRIDQRSLCSCVISLSRANLRNARRYDF